MVVNEYDVSLIEIFSVQGKIHNSRISLLYMFLPRPNLFTVQVQVDGFHGISHELSDDGAPVLQSGST